MQALHLLAEPTRMRILQLVWDQERSAGEIARQFRTTFGAVSQHLGRLRRAGLLRQRRDGRRLFYQADRAALGPLAAALEQMWTQQLTVLKALAEAEQHSLARPVESPTRTEPHLEAADPAPPLFDWTGYGGPAADRSITLSAASPPNHDPEPPHEHRFARVDGR